jgi:aminoglycoside phosphotransferase (APT) family kinase protein
MKFYKDKTYKRIEQYFEIFNNCDSDREVINGTSVPSIYELLDEIDWNWISDGVPVRFHGDLHFENILVSEKNNYNILPFILLDWRQDFCGELEYGDVYYDLAKLMHGLIISHEIINKNLYNFDRSMNEIKYDFLRKNINIDCEEIFLEYLEKWGYDVKKVKVMTALIFLNIAKFHHYPYSHLLFYLGKNLLNNEGKTI